MGYQLSEVGDDSEDQWTEQFSDGCTHYFEKEGSSCLFRLDRGQSDYLFVSRIEDLSDALLMPHTYHAAGEASMVCFINTSEKGASLEVSSVIGEALEAKPYIPLLYLMREVHSVANSGCTHECTPPELPEFTREIFL